MALLTSVDPYRPDEVVVERPDATPREIERAAASAARAGRAWRHTTGPERARALHAAAAALDARRDEFTALLVREVGKPVGEAAGEVRRSVDLLHYHATTAVLADGEHLPGGEPGALTYTVRRPLGAVALVTPWNFPLAIPLWKAAPALAVGNAVLLKPSTAALATATALVELLGEHVPDGTVALVAGEGDVVRALLPHVDAVSFTGSTAVGRIVVRAAAELGIPCQAEMGGSNPSVVLADADLDAAARSIAGAAMAFAGQKCTATSRIIVERAVLGGLRERLVAAVEQLGVGDPASPGTAVGPVISDAARSGALAALARSGGRVHTGGAALDDGFLLAPTLVEVDAGDALLADEVFAPVAAVVSAPDADAAFDLASATPYGLAASVYTRDLDAALRFTEQVDTGMVRVNSPTTGADYWAPFGGTKASSYGPHEQGAAAREFYTRPLTVTLGGGFRQR
ncbi:aldehyde dehydrogenase family protein [Pseudonocardia ailaonensis]|uniref:Aldehyde dehydrogenase family protein n=1 Tax=Pseudonocardia ailaonensis TaxID=367279 RepID=A0ABN2N3B1_9PSEU